CHLLNEKGYDAYIVGATIVNPELNTPVLTMELKKKHELKKKVPIAIYPEVVIDNPLEAKVCVRYFLNKNGLLTGRKVNVSENDLVFYHSKELSEGEGFDELGFLSVDPTRHDLFYYEGEGKRYRTLFYINRIPRDSVDFLAFGDVEVLSPNNRIGLIELSRLF